ncbi:MAG TPA: methyltransferase domain-containing protein, partial [Candidatus Polarisedimenticolaceae bacterium]|nr:methyltransferase domain-containing protein [Candidatus Polarisedimenticolaceae bacterium]
MDDLRAHFLEKYGPPEATGWGPRARFAFDYFTPADHYEAYVGRRVDERTRWLDVGCGRALFSSDTIARRLSDRCGLLVGLDPDDNLDENPYVHEKVKASLYDYRTERAFDLVTFNMVVEHITDPGEVVRVLSKLTAPGGEVVILTVFKWSPIPIATRLIPFRFHHGFKHM